MKSSGGRRDGRLWVIALGLSLLMNGLIVLGFGFMAMNTQVFQKKTSPSAATKAAEGEIVTIFPEIVSAQATPAPPPQEPEKIHYARTSADQASPRPNHPAFIGERDTEATSDRAPDPSKAPMPSQAGHEPTHPEDFETTESNYRDGVMADESPPTPLAAQATSEPTPIPDPSVAETKSEPEKEASPPPADHLLEGSNPVDILVAQSDTKTDHPKPTPPKQAKVAETPAPPKPKATAASSDPAFNGFQRKAAIQGSISRNGRSALSVADTPLGRYQAIISRAVEQEWQRNCTRHRDFITPGFLTVRFFVESTGRVRTVQFVGEMETGEVQKGFTLNSIRDAEIPAMPSALKAEYEKEPLEIIFNFYF